MAVLLNQSWDHRGSEPCRRGNCCQGHCLNQGEGLGERGEIPWLLSSSWSVISVFRLLKPELEKKRDTSLKVT